MIVLGLLSYFHNRPEPNMIDPAEFIAPRNGYAMSFRDFIPHLMNVMDQLGMSLHARTNFIKWVVILFLTHSFIHEFNTVIT